MSHEAFSGRGAADIRTKRPGRQGMGLLVPALVTLLATAAMGLLSGCGDGTGGTGSSEGNGGSGAGPVSSSSSTGNGTTTSSASTGAGGAGGTGGAGGAGGTGGTGGTGEAKTCDSIVEDLRADLEGTLKAEAADEGWPAPAGNHYLFVSTNPKLTLLAGEHEGWMGTPMNEDKGFRWLCLTVPAGTHYKFTDKTEWAADPWSRSYNYDNFGEISIVKPAESHLDRYFAVGDAEMAERTVRVWVPAGGYSRVLYVHDGQNLFDPEAFYGGWKLQESAPTGMLLVGIDNTPDRIDEYTHNQDVIGGDVMGGKGDAYADFVQSTVRPLIQKHYGEKGPIGTMGSSLGGLISFHIADKYPGEYAFAASLSGTMGWGSIGANNETMIERLTAHGHQKTYLYLDSGGGGMCLDSDNDGIQDDADAGDNYCENIQLRDALVSVGYVYGTDLTHWHEPNASHNEAAWAARVFRPLDIFEKL